MTFKETQRFRQWEILIPLGLLVAGTLYRIVGLVLDKGLASMPDLVPGLLILGSLGALSFFLLRLRLQVKVNEKGIAYRLSPFQGHKHKIRWDEVEFCEVVRTPARASLSGWDVRFDSREQVFSLCGRRGVHLRLLNGEEYFFGFHDVQTLKEVLTAVLLDQRPNEFEPGE